MTEHTLYSISGEIIGLGPSEETAQNTYYKHIWIRELAERQTTIQNVRAARELCPGLSTGTAATLYLVRSPSGHNCLFALDAGAAHAEALEPIARDQAKAFRTGITWMLGAVLLLGVVAAGWLLLPPTIPAALFWLARVLLVCSGVVGLMLLALTLRGIIKLSKAPKPKDMRAFVAAQRVAA